jgi:hypothetical protein
MDQWRKEAFDRLERSGYLPVMRSLAMGLCAPFWWHGQDGDGRYRILHNGTICFVNTGEKLIGVTAAHVYKEYLVDKARYKVFECQFGGSTVDPERYLIDRSEQLDLATFDIPSVLVSAAGSSVHHPQQWPTESVREREVVLFGGYPGILREAKDVKAEFPFQSFVTAVISVSTDNIMLHLDLPDLHWPLHDGEKINPELGGQSGGPVFRVVEGAPINRLELVGFICEISPSLVLARHASRVAQDGRIVSLSPDT